MQEEHSKKHTPIGVLLKSCQRQLKATARAGGDCNNVLVSKDLGLELLKLATVNQNKGFIIPISADLLQILKW